MKERLITFPQNRVWRTYPGGKVLDILAGKTEPEDTHFPEDWIGSVTRAKNPGREDIEEGLSTATVGGKPVPFKSVLESDPGYFLGEGHVERFGIRPQLLVKLLDSAVRLHFQCHPTAKFARNRMNEPSGKAEAYHILAIRKEIENPYVYIGFQHPPEKRQLRQWIKEQNMVAIEACFDKIPVKPGDTLFIPGGYPHAIGEGILMVEVMEPSDLAVRFEFEKGGYVLPEEARFMGRDLDFALEVFDYSQVGPEKLRKEAMFKARNPVTYAGGNGECFELIGAETTPCMRIRKSFIKGPVRKESDSCFIGIVTKGSATFSLGKDSRMLKPFDKFFYPAGAENFRIEPEGEVDVLECYPPSVT